MSDPDNKKTDTSNSPKWERIKKSLEELENISKHNKDKSVFEYELIIKAKEMELETEQYRKIFKEFYTKKNSCFKNIYAWINETSLFSVGQRFSIILGILVSVITFLPTQQTQKRTELARNKIEQDRANLEAWRTINSNRIDSDGNLIQASSGRITALQNLNKNRVPLQGLEVPEAFLLGVDLGGADLYRANFQGADFYKANFSSKPAQTNSWICSSWLLEWTKLYDCKSETDLQKWPTDLERANFRGAILYKVSFNDNDLKYDDKLEPDIDLFRADFSPFYRGKGNQNKPFEKDSDLAIECFSKKPVIQCARANNAQFIGANLKYSDFTKANLKGANFKNANLECVSFRGAIFNSATDKDPNLPEGIPPTNFEGADLKGADLRDLAVPTDFDKMRDLSPKQIMKAKNWEKAFYSQSLLKELNFNNDSYKPFKCLVYDKETIR